LQDFPQQNHNFVKLGDGGNLRPLIKQDFKEFQMFAKIEFFVALLVASGSASAYTPTAEEKKCGTGVYCADKMVCTGTIRGAKPRGMHPSHFNQIFTAQAMKSTKNLPNGRKGLVDVMVTGEDSVGAQPISLAQAKAQATDGSWYGAPARVRGDRVYIPGIQFSRGYNFKIVSSVNRGNSRVDYLTGTQKIVGSVVPDHTWSYECEAVVVEAPSRIDDLTRP